MKMTDAGRDSLESEYLKVSGAVDVLFELREQFAQWVDEAQDSDKKEALENVLDHVESTEAEYKRRFEEMRARLNAN